MVLEKNIFNERLRPYVINHADGSRGGGGGHVSEGVQTSLENHKWLITLVTLEILVRTPLERQLGPILSGGRFNYDPL